MSRPFYAKPEDIEAQDRAVAELRKRMDLQCAVRLKLFAFPVTHQFIDAHGNRFGAKVITRTEALQVLERKGGYGIGKDRWQRMKAFVERKHWGLWIVLNADEHLWHCDAMSHDSVYQGGRWDRGDDKDREPMVTFRFHRWTDHGAMSSSSLPLW